MKYLAILLLFISYHADATLWPPALPYTKTYDNLDVKVKAVAYQPYVPYPAGKTDVYKNNKLLYTIDEYFRDYVFVSKDGVWLAVHGSGYFPDINYINDYDYPMITIFKNGKYFKSYLIKDLVDTNIITSKFVFYHCEFIAERKLDFSLNQMVRDCESCIEVYGQSLSICDTVTDQIDINDCVECKRKCDSVKLINNEQFITSNSLYLKNNVLHVLTNYNTVIKIDFNNECVLSKHPFSSVIPDKYDFNPPCVSTIYNEITMPDKFDMPKLKSGIAFEDALANYLGYKNGSVNKNEMLTIVFEKMVINTNGHCEELDLGIWNADKYEYMASYNNQSERAFLQKVYNWVMLQEYDTKLIPIGYEKYCFYCRVHMH